jgi:cyclophilin family peptidyl-prolyl cis-trans isomerase
MNTNISTLLFLCLLTLVFSGCLSNSDKDPCINFTDPPKTKPADPAEQQNASSDLTLNNNMEKNNHENNSTIDTKKALPFADKYAAALIKTNLGDIKVDFFNSDAPITVDNFLKLANQGFYNGTKFHRVIRDFMIQGGDPNSKDDDWSNDGIGGPGYKFKDEINNIKLVRGSLAMANSGPDTNGSQFFIVTAEATPWLDGKHTNFGQVVEGMEIIDKIENTKTNENDHPTSDIEIEKIELIEK